MRDDANVEPLCRCPHLQYLLDAEQRLRAALTLAREQLLHAERILDHLTGVRHGSVPPCQPRDPYFVRRVVTSPVQDDICSDTADGAPMIAAAATVLTLRETEVLELIATGLSNRRIAETLYLSPRTIERHIANIYLKLDVHSKAEATAWALVHGLLGGRTVPDGSVPEAEDRRRPKNYICRLHTSTDA